MPAGRDGDFDREVIIMGRFLSSLSSAVPTPTWFVLWDANHSTVPVHPLGLKVCYFTSAKPEAARNKTDKSCFKVVRRWKCRTRFQKEFELAIGEDIFMRVSGCEGPSMTVRTFSCRLVVVRHP